MQLGSGEEFAAGMMTSPFAKDHNDRDGPSVPADAAEDAGVKDFLTIRSKHHAKDPSRVPPGVLV
jgi:hypothetical protein